MALVYTDILNYLLGRFEQLDGVGKVITLVVLFIAIKCIWNFIVKKWLSFKRYCRQVWRKFWSFSWLFGSNRKKLPPKRRLGKRRSDPLQVHFIDVGAGDCVLIQCDGRDMLIDGGGYDDGKEILEYLNACGVAKLDAVVCTHEHNDHSGGLLYLSRKIYFGKLYAPAKSYAENEGFNKLVAQCKSSGVKLIIPKIRENMRLGGAVFTFIAPMRSYKSKDEGGDPINNHSIVMRMEYGKHSFLFTGDIEEEAEKDLVSSRLELRSKVLKVAHHGSLSSSTESFLRAVSPKYAVISAGIVRVPPEKTLSKLRKVRAKVYQTYRHGDVRFYCNKSHMEIVHS